MRATARRASELLSSIFSKNLKKTSLETILRVCTEISKFHESAILVDVVEYLTVAARVATGVKHVVW